MENCSDDQRKSQIIFYTVANNATSIKLLIKSGFKLCQNHNATDKTGINPEYILEEESLNLENAISNLLRHKEPPSVVSNRRKKYAEIAEIIGISVKAC